MKKPKRKLPAPIVVETEGSELVCACGIIGDDPAGWEIGDGGAEDRCPECRLEDPEGDGPSAGLSKATILALGAVATKEIKEEKE